MKSCVRYTKEVEVIQTIDEAKVNPMVSY